MLNLHEELKTIPWVEQGFDNSSMQGDATVEGMPVKRVFAHVQGKSHEMRYGGTEDVKFSYETIRLTSFDGTWDVISLTQKIYDDGVQNIEISLDAISNQATIDEQTKSGLAVGAVLPVTYSLHENGVLPKLGSSWKGSETDRGFLKKTGLIIQSSLPDQINVDETARNIVLAAKNIDFGLQPQTILARMAH